MGQKSRFHEFGNWIWWWDTNNVWWILISLLVRNVLWETTTDQIIPMKNSRNFMLNKSLSESSTCYSYIDKILMWAIFYKQDVKTSLVDFGMVVCFMLEIVNFRKPWSPQMFLENSKINRSFLSAYLSPIVPFT